MLIASLAVLALLVGAGWLTLSCIDEVVKQEGWLAERENYHDHH